MSEAWGTGLATVTGDGRVLDVLFADPQLGPAEGSPGTTTGAVVHEDPRRGVQVVEVTTVLDDLDSAPTDPYDAYLRLHLLSHRLVKPHGLSTRRAVRGAAERRVDERGAGRPRRPRRGPHALPRRR